MMAIGRPTTAMPCVQNRLVIDGIGGVRPMRSTNGRGSGQIAILASFRLLGCLDRHPGILRRPASWRGAPPSSRRAKLKSRRTLGAPPSAISSLGQLPTPAVGGVEGSLWPGGPQPCTRTGPSAVANRHRPREAMHTLISSAYISKCAHSTSVRLSVE